MKEKPKQNNGRKKRQKAKKRRKVSGKTIRTLLVDMVTMTWVALVPPQVSWKPWQHTYAE